VFIQTNNVYYDLLLTLNLFNGRQFTFTQALISLYCICPHTSAHMCLYVCSHVFLRLLMCVCTSALMCFYVCSCVFVRLLSCVFTSAHVCLYVCSHVFVCRQPVEKKQKDMRRQSVINTEHLKKFIARQRWKVRLNTVCYLIVQLKTYTCRRL